MPMRCLSQRHRNVWTLLSMSPLRIADREGPRDRGLPAKPRRAGSMDPRTTKIDPVVREWPMAATQCHRDRSGPEAMHNSTFFSTLYPARPGSPSHRPRGTLTPTTPIPPSSPLAEFPGVVVTFFPVHPSLRTPIPTHNTTHTPLRLLTSPTKEILAVITTVPSLGCGRSVQLLKHTIT